MIKFAVNYIQMRHIIAIILLMYAANAYSQATIKGKITDENRSVLELVNVRVEGRNIGTTSNLKGEYRLKVPTADTITLVYSMLGYQTRKRTLTKPKGEITLDVVLPSVNVELDGVTISEVRRQTTQTQKFNLKDTHLSPNASGNGVESFIATQAGVSSHNELSSQYNVRGGSFDENCVYINGVEVYRPLLVRSGQQEGLSIINSDMVNEVGFSSGGFEARYSDKMSSVLDISYKKPEKTEATVTASLLGGTAYLGTKKGNLSFSNAVRYKTSRYLLGTLETNGEYKPNYIDYQAYLSWKPNKKWDLDIIGNISENHYNFTPTDRETKFGTMNDAKVFKVYFGGEEKDIFRTYFGSLKLTRHLGDYTSVSLIGGIFKTEEKETFDITSQYWLNNQSEEESMGVGTDFEHTRNYLKAKVSSIELQIKSQRTHNTLLAGIKLKHEDIKEKSTEWIMRDSAGYSIPISAEALKVAYNLHSSNHITSSRLEAFVQNTYRSEIKPGIINLTYGVRLAYWNFNKELIVSPRVSLGLIPKFNDNFTFRIATGIYYQSPFYKEIRKVIETENGCEVTLNKDIKSQRSIHYVGGMDYKFRMLNRPFKFTTEVFYKSLSNLIPYSVDNVRLSYYGENVSDGYIAGIDMKLYGEFVKGTDSWISFSVMKANERINGTTVPLPTDQRYNLSLFFNDYFPNSTRWKMSLRCSLADGLPFGPPHSKREEQVFRAPAYKRVDIGMSYRLIKNEELENKRGVAKYIRNAWLGIDAFNLLNISNVNSYYWITDVSNVKYAVPNYLTMRQINTRLLIEF